MGWCFWAAAGMVLQDYSEFWQGLIRGIKKVPAVLWGTGGHLFAVGLGGLRALRSLKD